MADPQTPIDEAVAAIRSRWQAAPAWGIVLGSGLGSFADEIDAEATFDYPSLPHFPSTTAAGHRGRLVCGKLAGVPVVAMQGRFHLYEGWSAEQASFPVRVMNALGANHLLLSNAAGGVNPYFQVGDLMLINDHINLMFATPRIAGAMTPRPGNRVPTPYCPQLARLASAAARQNDLPLQRGVYVGMLGPNYETRAEYRMTRRIGGDAVGMSTIPEAITAAEVGMRTVAFSVITNACSPDALSETTHEEVVAASNAATQQLTTIARGLIQQ